MNHQSYNSIVSAMLRVKASLRSKDSKEKLLKKEDNCGEVEVGTSRLISTQFESLDYDICESYLYLEGEKLKKSFDIVYKDVLRWVVVVLIGLSTALVAGFVNISIEYIANWKYSLIRSFFSQYYHNLLVPCIVWWILNCLLVLLSAGITALYEPAASGPGIGNVICYLNGVKVPRVVRFRTLLVKIFGVITSVSSGLAVGQEGPFIHMGAVIGAGVSQGKSTTFRADWKIFKEFREDHEKRDFVSAGAAAGISAAFGAPVGGVLFSLEEGASFWNQSLTWRILLCSMISFFSLNLILSAYHGVPGELSHPGLLNLGNFNNLTYTIYEFPFFLLMGLIGGVSGAVFNSINYALTSFRMKYIYKNSHKVFEALVVIMTTTSVAMLMVLLLNDCRPLGEDPVENPVKIFCGDGEYNAAAAMWFQTGEPAVRSLFHDPEGSQRIPLLFVFSICYSLMACWSHGTVVPSGLFVPSLLAGAAWGRLIGIVIRMFFPKLGANSAGKYALIGAAAQLAGVTRSTLSLAVLLIEATGNITFGLPIMVTLMVAKWTADYLIEGIYEIGIRLSGAPLLPFDPPPLCCDVEAAEIMSCPVVTLKPVESVDNIFRMLKGNNHNGFPVVDNLDANNELESSLSTFGRCQGLILRSQLIVVLQNRLFLETVSEWKPEVTIDVFRDAYPRYKDVTQIEMSAEELKKHIDLRPFMNPNPYTVFYSTSVARVFRLFRGLGLRHLIVTERNNEVVGIITRKDLAKYRVSIRRGYLKLEEIVFV